MNDTATKVKKTILFVGDIFILYSSLTLTLYLRYWPNFQLRQLEEHLLPFSLIYLAWLLIFFISGLYDINLAKNTLTFYATLFRSIAICALLAATFFYLIPFFDITPKTNLVINIAIVTIIIWLWRQLFNKLVKSQALLNNVLIVSKNKTSLQKSIEDNPELEQLLAYVKNNPQLGYRIKKIISEKETEVVFDLIETIVRGKIQTIVTVPDPRQNTKLIKNLYHCLPLKISLFDLPKFYERITGKVPISVIEETWFLENLMNEQKSIYEVFKRWFDFIFSLILGIISLFLYPFISLAIKLDTRGPVFYRQKRVGQDSKIFEIIKFRSMVDNAENNGAQWAKRNDPRVTSVGSFLRKTRMDELPQLINIFKGEMSFVGPRPERPEFVFGTNMERQIPFYQIRHLVKPGLTGWAQINFEYGASYEDTLEKLQYDFFYLKNRSFILDLSVVLKTIKIILSREGI